MHGTQDFFLTLSSGDFLYTGSSVLRLGSARGETPSSAPEFSGLVGNPLSIQ